MNKRATYEKKGDKSESKTRQKLHEKRVKENFSDEVARSPIITLNVFMP